MARVTVEDCIEKVTNRFELVIVASQRSRQISAGADPLIERDNDKNPVIALREIADDKVAATDLVNEAIESMQRQIEIDEPEEDDFDAIADGRTLTSTDQEYTDEVAATTSTTTKATAEDDDPHPKVSYEDVTSDEVAAVQKS